MLVGLLTFMLVSLENECETETGVQLPSKYETYGTLSIHEQLRKNLTVNLTFTLNDCIIFRYDMSNCLFEATLQQIEKDCGCAPKYFVDMIEGFEACEGIQKQCMTTHMEAMGEQRIILDGGKQKVFTIH